MVWSLDDARTTPATTVPVANTRPVVRVQPPTPQPEPTPHTASNPTPMFFVFGEVAHPGPYKYTGKNRVLDMIAQVQPTRRADPARVLLVTPSPDGGARDVVEINVDRMIRTGDTSNNPVIDEGQVLYVPPHALARIGLTLRAIFKPNATTDHPTPNG